MEREGAEYSGVGGMREGDVEASGGRAAADEACGVDLLARSGRGRIGGAMVNVTGVADRLRCACRSSSSEIDARRFAPVTTFCSTEAGRATNPFFCNSADNLPPGVALN